EGKIEPGDYDKFLDGILCPEAYRDDICPSLVYLASPGGDLAEAIKIGRLVRQLRLDTEIPNDYIRRNPAMAARYAEMRDLNLENPKANGMCASACFFIFVAGIYRTTFGTPVLGIHRPYMSDVDLKKISSNQAITSATQVRVTVESYLKEMGVATKYVDLMFSIAKDHVRWINRDDFEADFQGFIPELSDWVAAQCYALKNVDKQVECER